MTRTFLSAAGALALSASVHSAPVSAATCARARAITTTAMTTFRLRAADKPSADTTFWVAYGPLNGRFGLVRLHPSGPSTYQARKRLPVTGRTTFAYLAAHGMVQTRFGPAPGDPVQTIQRFGPVSVPNLRLPTVTWHTPIG